MAEIGYDAAGNVMQLVSPLQQATTFAHDANGCLTSTTTPDNRLFSFQHDRAGNVTAVIPPGPAGDHHFAYDSRGLVAESTLVDAGPGDETTSYAYSGDAEPELITLADGSEVEIVFDPATGHLVAVTTPGGAMTFTYFPNNSATPGKLESTTSVDGVAETFAYNGALLTDVAWSGPVLGALHFTYDNQFRVASEAVGNTPAVARGWNLDGQLVQAGDLQITYHPTTGVLQGTVVDAVPVSKQQPPKVYTDFPVEG